MGGTLAARSFGLRQGDEYTVFGLFFAYRSAVFGTGAWVEILNEPEYPQLGLAYAPLALFQIVDPTIPSSWTVGISDETVDIGPELLRQPNFNDRLTNGDPALLLRFHELVASLGLVTARRSGGRQPSDD